MTTFVAYITIKGKRYYAKDYGKKAFPINGKRPKRK